MGRKLRLEPRTGGGLRVARGECVKAVDVDGGQVADLVAFARDDPGEHLSNGRTFDHGGSIYVTEGGVLYSSRSRPMWTVVEDTVGRHDFLFAACSVEMFRVQYGIEDAQSNCLDNLRVALLERELAVECMPTPLNLFMNAPVGPDGTIEIRPPRSGPGDYVVLRAEQDLVVAVSACSAPTCNDGTFGPIELEVTDRP